jgi:hypothetical protein
MKLVLGLNILLQSPLSALHRRTGFKGPVSSFRFSLFLKRNYINAMWTFYGCSRNECITRGPFMASTIIWVGCVCDLLLYGHVDRTAGPRTCGKCWCKKFISSPGWSKWFVSNSRITSLCFLKYIWSAGSNRRIEKIVRVLWFVLFT